MQETFSPLAGEELGMNGFPRVAIHCVMLPPHPNPLLSKERENA
jgi:hypothetical protein